MISHFFIDRPIFASVLSIVFVLAGGVAVFALPVAQYPEVTPPTVLVTAVYPGANAQTVRDTVAAPIEVQVSGARRRIIRPSARTRRLPRIAAVPSIAASQSGRRWTIRASTKTTANPDTPPMMEEAMRRMVPDANNGISVSPWMT